jgi:DNA repair protein RecN (Recombination protein N)
MLRELAIEQYGLIERADVEFAGGATIFTGETGSGKTMLLGALDFVLGARAGSDVVRSGAPRALVALAFEPDEAFRARLTADGFELDRSELGTIVREMSDAGRSSLRVNGRAATAAYVREIREAIAEIVGQHEAQRLLTASYHLELLDRFAGEAAIRARDAVAAAYVRAEEADRALVQLTQDDRSARGRYDDACFAVRDIEEARLEPGELERLTERRAYLDNVERIASALHVAHEALAPEEGGAVGALGVAATVLAGVGVFDAELRDAAGRAAALQSESVELSVGIARALEAAAYDPAELDAINARLETLERLKRKYGTTIEDVLAAAQRARRTIEEHEGRDVRIAQLESESAAAKLILAEAASALSATRSKAAKALSKRVVAEFGELALASGGFEAAIQPLERIGPLGAERVEFLFAANAGEAMRPLARVASGGELSRVLLALVVVLADARDAGTALVFDEIDAGIGGATAAAVGARLGDLARRGQVVCVTHLAQLATWADRHYVLDKIERRSETTIVTRAIGESKEREAEIARMLSGESHDAAIAHARAMLRVTKRRAKRSPTESDGSSIRSSPPSPPAFR